MPDERGTSSDQAIEPQSLSDMREDLGRMAHAVLSDERWARWRPAVDIPAVLGFIIVVALLLAPPGSNKLPLPEIDSVSANTIRAERDLLIEDKRATELRRIAAARNIPQIFDYDSELYFTLGDRVTMAFDNVHERRNAPGIDDAQRRDLFERDLGLPVKPGIFSLVEGLADPRDAAIAINFFLNMGLDRMIIADRSDLPPGDNIEIRDLTLNNRSLPGQVGSVLDLRQLHRLMTARAGDAPYGSARIVRTWLLETAQDMARANLRPNGAATAERQSAMVAAIEPVFLRIEAGEVLVRSGDRVTVAAHEKIAMLNSHSEARTVWGETAAVAGLLAAIMALGGFFFNRGRVPNGMGRKATYMTLGISGATAAVCVAIYYTGFGLTESFSVDSRAAAYFMPVALATVLVALLVDARTSLLAGIALTLLLAYRVNGDLSLVTYDVVGVLVAGIAARHSRRRIDLLRIGIAVALAQLAVFPVTVILAGQSIDTGLMVYVAGALVSGLLVGIGTLALLPVLELVFDETTDPRLLELASADSPLLKEMALKAPGTYHHATMVANLAEAGADSIDANGLMCRVMALYHDIGKIRRPSYFAENQRAGDNIHDRLPPDVSARVVLAHIRDGIEMAQKARLGRAILDGISQHQGTTLLRGFYEKARAQGFNGPEEAYRYPGPRPQRREAGILLLADSTEAATRALKDPSPAAVRQRVRDVISARVGDGQLDECGLTLRDLAALEETFARTLSLGVYHNRIDYPPVSRNSTGTDTSDGRGNRHHRDLSDVAGRSA